MRLIALALLLLLLALAAPAQAAGPKVRTTACVTSLDAAERTARFEGDMRTVARAVKLQIRFVLQARTPERPAWHDVKAPGFGSWSTSAAGIARYVHVKTVEQLLAPASYRTVVSFRWLGAGGDVLLRARRVSRTCRQPDLRPDLSPLRLLRDGDAYAVTVGNAGRTDAEPFAVSVGTQLIGRVARLAAGARTTVRGGRIDCAPGDTVTVQVDPENRVDEADEGSNRALLTCPGPVA